MKKRSAKILPGHLLDFSSVASPKAPGLPDPISKAVFDAGETELRKLGRHMRDGLCQELAGIGLLVETFQGRIPCHNSPCEREIIAIGAMLRQAIKVARRIVRVLEPLESDPKSLPIALRHLAEDASSKSGPRCNFKGPSSLHITDPAVAIQLYRVAQMCLGHLLPQTCAEAATLVLKQTKGHVELRIRLHPVPPNRHRDLAKSPVWAMIHHRARAMGAGLTVSSRGGLCLICRAPNRKAGNHAVRKSQGRNPSRNGRGKEKSISR